MRDPHVRALAYRLLTTERVTFESPPPIEWETEAFRLRLEDGRARVEMIEHYAAEEEARERVEPYLRAWETDHGLWAGEPEILFEFETAEMIDRDPPPRPAGGGPVRLELHVAGEANVAGTLTVHKTRRSYREPPGDFLATPTVETLWRRWVGYLEGREPVLGMAYFCLTVIEAQGGLVKKRRRKAAQALAIEERVLDTLGRLTSEVGDELSARKFNPASRPLSGEEKAWVEAAVRALVRRLGVVAAKPATTPPMLRMTDLPDLSR